MSFQLRIMDLERERYMTYSLFYNTTHTAHTNTCSTHNHKQYTYNTVRTSTYNTKHTVYMNTYGTTHKVYTNTYSTHKRTVHTNTYSTTHMVHTKMYSTHRHIQYNTSSIHTYGTAQFCHTVCLCASLSSRPPTCQSVRGAPAHPGGQPGEIPLLSKGQPSGHPLQVRWMNCLWACLPVFPSFQSPPHPTPCGTCA